MSADVIEIGERFQIPTEKGCGHMGRIVWISEDEKTIGVLCYASHPRDTITGDRYKGNERVGNKTRKVPTEKKNVVYLIGLDS